MVSGEAEREAVGVGGGMQAPVVGSRVFPGGQAERARAVPRMERNLEAIQHKYL